MGSDKKGFNHAGRSFKVPENLIAQTLELDDATAFKLLLYLFSRNTLPDSSSHAISWEMLVKDRAWSRDFSLDELRSALEKLIQIELLQVEKLNGEPKYWLNYSDVDKSTRMEAAPQSDPVAGDLFSLYEANIGRLSPIIADAIQYARENYPPEWIEEGIQIAAKMNKRSWKYIEAILKRWKEEGHDKVTDRQNAKKSDKTGSTRNKLDDFLSGD